MTLLFVFLVLVGAWLAPRVTVACLLMYFGYVSFGMCLLILTIIVGLLKLLAD